MFYENTFADGLGTGWTQIADGVTVIDGALAPVSGNDSLGWRYSDPAATGGEIYSEITISAIGVGSEISTGIATTLGATSWSALGLVYARYQHDNARLQIMTKAGGSTTPGGLGSRIDGTLSLGTVVRIQIHLGQAELWINGVKQRNATLTNAADYLYPGVRFDSDSASRVSKFKTGDYGVESAPGGGTPTMSGVTANYWDGAAEVPLTYQGVWNGTSLDTPNLTYDGTTP